MPEAVAERCGLDAHAGASGHELDAGGPQPLETQIVVQAHAVHGVRRGLERTHGDAERGGEVVAVERLAAEQWSRLVEPRDQLAVLVERSASGGQPVDRHQGVVEAGEQRLLDRPVERLELPGIVRIRSQARTCSGSRRAGAPWLRHASERTRARCRNPPSRDGACPS